MDRRITETVVLGNLAGLLGGLIRAGGSPQWNEPAGKEAIGLAEKLRERGVLRKRQSATLYADECYVKVRALESSSKYRRILYMQATARPRANTARAQRAEKPLAIRRLNGSGYSPPGERLDGFSDMPINQTVKAIGLAEKPREWRGDHVCGAVLTAERGAVLTAES